MTNRPEEGVADDEAVGWVGDETEKHKEWNRKSPVSHVKGCADLAWRQWEPTQSSSAAERGGVHW